jgi:hypothetical protein
MIEPTDLVNTTTFIIFLAFIDTAVIASRFTWVVISTSIHIISHIKTVVRTVLAATAIGAVIIVGIVVTVIVFCADLFEPSRPPW